MIKISIIVFLLLLLFIPLVYAQKSPSFIISPSFQTYSLSDTYTLSLYDVTKEEYTTIIDKGDSIRIVAYILDSNEPVYIKYGISELTSYLATFSPEYSFNDTSLYYIDTEIPSNAESGLYDIEVQSGSYIDEFEDYFYVTENYIYNLLEESNILDSPFQSLFVIVNQTTGTYINMTINSPINMTYSSNIPLTINIDLSISTNGTNLIVYWNIFQSGMWRLDNLTYPLYDQFTVSNNGTYTFYVWAIVDEGSLTNTVMFSSSIITGGGTSVSTGNGTLVPLIFALILILLSLIALVAKQPIIGIIIFIFSFAICGIFLINDVNMPYNPYSTIMVIFISLICMLINIIEKNT